MRRPEGFHVRQIGEFVNTATKQGGLNRLEASARKLDINTQKQYASIVCSQSGIVDPLHPAQGVLDITAAGFEYTLLDLGMYCSAGELESLGKPRRKTEENTSSVHILVSKQPAHIHKLAAPLLEKCRQEKLKISIMTAPRLARDTKLFSQKDATKHDIKDTTKCSTKDTAKDTIKDTTKDTAKDIHSNASKSVLKNVPEIEGLLRALTIESIYLCQKADCRYLIVEPLSAGIDRGEEWGKNREFYLSLAGIARENHVTILLKNQCRFVNGHLVRGICSDAIQAAQWIDWLNQEAGEERFGFCMDVGICSLCGQDMREFILPLGKRLKAVILRDCDGHREASMLPFTCVGGGQSQTDWLGVIRGLRESCYDGLLVLDFAGTASAFSPILRPQLMQLAKAVGSYLAWQIGIESLLRKYTSIVLFGAGNMCRNYMKCYGKKYPPLFTCDNNSKLWGGSFCGLSVQSPESLKSLPEGCGIFICNIYYREIEEQLHSMGITENIELFNDEYMPSFYFDRLEVRRDD